MMWNLPSDLPFVKVLTLLSCANAVDPQWKAVLPGIVLWAIWGQETENQSNKLQVALLLPIL